MLRPSLRPKLPHLTIHIPLHVACLPHILLSDLMLSMRVFDEKVMNCVLVSNVAHGRAPRTGERRTPPTLRTCLSVQLNNVIRLYIDLDIINQLVLGASFLHVRELCPVFLHLVQRAKAWRLTPDCALT
jgi:hypothetical protein